MIVNHYCVQFNEERYPFHIMYELCLNMRQSSDESIYVIVLFQVKIKVCRYFEINPFVLILKYKTLYFVLLTCNTRACFFCLFKVSFYFVGCVTVFHTARLINKFRSLFFSLIQGLEVRNRKTLSTIICKQSVY